MSARKIRRRKSNVLAYFLLFAALALGIVIVLEYLDHRNGKPTFLLSRVLGRPHGGKAVDAGKPKDSFHHKLMRLMDSRDPNYSLVQDSRGRYHVKWKLGDEKRKKVVDELEKLAKVHGRHWKIEEVQHLNGEHLYLYSIHSDAGEASHLMLITTGAPAPEAAPLPDSGKPIKGRLAVIIDDIGFNELGSLELKRLGVPVTAAVIPHAPYAYDEARQLHMYGIEQIIHLPMQAANRNLEPDPDQFVLKGADLTTIRRLIHRSRTLVPYARGINNHMGSLTTGDPQTMSRVLSVLKEEGLFFVDSRTSVSTVAYSMARKMNVAATQRDVFLEDINNDQVTYHYARSQVIKGAKLARSRGYAVAIGHPYPTTLKAIRDAVNEVRGMGVHFVPVSRLLEK
ncbi:MAG TPA: divergent polysaccharide deacetylase family protein [Candidatus Aminicenantes bacterium]|nr:divergent polysaccharide deacetylase family protein [Candidatus Aminicenantes bacterium]